MGPFLLDFESDYKFKKGDIVETDFQGNKYKFEFVSESGNRKNFQHISYKLSQILFLDKDFTGSYDTNIEFADITFEKLINNSFIKKYYAEKGFQIDLKEDESFPTEKKDIQFSEDNLLTVLQKIAEIFGVEYEIEETKIIFKNQIGEIKDITINAGVNTKSLNKRVDTSNICTRLYPSGSSENLSTFPEYFYKRLKPTIFSRTETEETIPGGYYDWKQTDNVFTENKFLENIEIYDWFLVIEKMFEILGEKTAAELTENDYNSIKSGSEFLTGVTLSKFIDAYNSWDEKVYYRYAEFKKRCENKWYGSYPEWEFTVNKYWELPEKNFEEFKERWDFEKGTTDELLKEINAWMTSVKYYQGNHECRIGESTGLFIEINSLDSKYTISEDLKNEIEKLGIIERSINFDDIKVRNYKGIVDSCGMEEIFINTVGFEANDYDKWKEKWKNEWDESKKIIDKETLRPITGRELWENRISAYYREIKNEEKRAAFINIFRITVKNSDDEPENLDLWNGSFESFIIALDNWNNGVNEKVYTKIKYPYIIPKDLPEDFQNSPLLSDVKILYHKNHIHRYQDLNIVRVVTDNGLTKIFFNNKINMDNVERKINEHDLPDPESSFTLVGYITEKEINDASEELFERAKEYLYDNLKPVIEFDIDFTKFRTDLVLNCGDTVNVVDRENGIDETIRIDRIEYDLSQKGYRKIHFSSSTNKIPDKLVKEIVNTRKTLKFIQNYLDSIKSYMNILEYEKIYELKNNLDFLSDKLDVLTGKQLEKANKYLDSLNSKLLKIDFKNLKGKVTTAQLEVDEIVSNAIWTNKIIANEAFMNSLTSSEAWFNALTAESGWLKKLVADEAWINSLTSNNIFSQNIYSNHLSSHLMTADKLAIGTNIAALYDQVISDCDSKKTKIEELDFANLKEEETTYLKGLIVEIKKEYGVISENLNMNNANNFETYKNSYIDLTQYEGEYNNEHKKIFTDYYTAKSALYSSVRGLSIDITEIDKIKQKINNITDDSLITPEEKKILLSKWENIVQQKKQIDDTFDKYFVESDSDKKNALNVSYNALRTCLTSTSYMVHEGSDSDEKTVLNSDGTKIINTTNKMSENEKTQFLSKFDTYYNEVNALIKLIEERKSSVLDDSRTFVDGSKINIGNCVELGKKVIKKEGEPDESYGYIKIVEKQEELEGENITESWMMSKEGFGKLLEKDGYRNRQLNFPCIVKMENVNITENTPEALVSLPFGIPQERLRVFHSLSGYSALNTANSGYIASILTEFSNSVIPSMSTEEQNGFKISGPSFGDYYVYNAFNSNSLFWAVDKSYTNPEILINCPEKFSLNSYSLKSSNECINPNSCILYGKNIEGIWEVIDSQSNINWDTFKKSFSISAEKKEKFYNEYKFTFGFDSNENSNLYGLSKIELRSQNISGIKVTSGYVPGDIVDNGYINCKSDTSNNDYNISTSAANLINLEVGYELTKGGSFHKYNFKHEYDSTTEQNINVRIIAVGTNDFEISRTLEVDFGDGYIQNTELPKYIIPTYSEPGEPVPHPPGHIDIPSNSLRYISYKTYNTEFKTVPANVNLMVLYY